MALDRRVTHVVLLHGFTQTPSAWDDVRADLEARGVRCVAPWLPGHGPGATDPGTWDDALDALDDAVAREVPAARGSDVACAWVGYSMGARLALGLALRRPARVASLALLSGTAGIEGGAARAARCAEDEALAARIAAIGVSAFVDEWLARPMFAGLDAAGARASDRRAAHGTTGLAAALRRLGAGAQPDLWPRLGELGVPTLVVAGARDDKFVAIARRMAAAVPSARLEVLDGLGHAVAVEAPRLVAALVADHVGR